MLVPPEAVQARGDEADVRIPVVPIAQGRDEVQEHLLDLRVVVVGGEGDPLVVVEVVGVASGDDGVHGDGCPFERVGQGVATVPGALPSSGAHGMKPFIGFETVAGASLSVVRWVVAAD